MKNNKFFSIYSIIAILTWSSLSLGQVISPSYPINIQIELEEAVVQLKGDVKESDIDTDKCKGKFYNFTNIRFYVSNHEVAVPLKTLEKLITTIGSQKLVSFNEIYKYTTKPLDVLTPSGKIYSFSYSSNNNQKETLSISIDKFVLWENYQNNGDKNCPSVNSYTE